MTIIIIIIIVIGLFRKKMIQMLVVTLNLNDFVGLVVQSMER